MATDFLVYWMMQPFGLALIGLSLAIPFLCWWLVLGKTFATVGFKPLKIRWVVERTFAWIGRYRRNSKDYEVRTDSSEGMIQLSSISLMLGRLAPKEPKGPAFRYPRPAAVGV